MSIFRSYKHEPVVNSKIPTPSKVTETLYKTVEYLQSFGANVYAGVSQQEEIAVGDIIIVQNDKTNRNFWGLAKVEELLPGDDRVLRAVMIKTCSRSEIKRKTWKFYRDQVELGRIPP